MRKEKAMEMTKRLEKPSEEQIKVMKERLLKIGIAVPEKYLNFLKEEGGGQPSNKKFTTKSDNGELHTTVNCFFGISSNLSLDLYHNAVIYSDRIPDDLLPIGTDGVGNMICIGVSQHNQNQIFMWWANDVSDIAQEPSHDYVDLYSHSFDEFINSNSQSST